MNVTTSGWLSLMILAGLPMAAWGQASASSYGRYHIYDHTVPPGQAGAMNLMAGRLRPQILQQIRVHLPAKGSVTFFDGSPQRPVSAPAPAQAAVLVGLMYRLKLDLPEYPNIEFFPSVEVIDELHPPPGQAERFPIEIEFLPEELEWAARGRMVTKVVYLEQADRVPLKNLGETPRVIDVEAGGNAVAEADVLGRPIAIVRLGGRTPDPHYPDPQFWGPLPPIQLIAARPALPAEGPAPMTQRRPTHPAFRAGGNDSSLTPAGAVSSTRLDSSVRP